MKFLTTLIFLFVLSLCSIEAALYYVAPTGNDGNTKTLAQSITTPWKTINASSNKLAAGDTLYVRGGSYHEVIEVWNSGTESSPIVIMAYPGELPIVDGEGTLPTGNWSNLVSLTGNYIYFSGFEVKNTKLGSSTLTLHTGGIFLNGHHCKVSKTNVHHCYFNGILIKGDYGIVEDCKVWQVNLENVNGQNIQGWGSGLSAARDNVDGITDFAIIRRNEVYNCWGEAISAYESQGCLIEDNVIYDNWQVNVYISDSRNTVFQRNLVYNTPNNAVAKQGGGLWMADERSSVPRSDNNVLRNNMFLNCDLTLFAWTIVPSSGFTNVLFANNTCVGARLSTGSNNTASRIINNIFTVNGNINTSAGLTFGNNVWQSGRPSNAYGIGDLLYNPLLLKTGTVAPGQLTADYFKVSATSPAINGGRSLVEVNSDYFNVNRSATPTVGAIEFQSTNGIPTQKNNEFSIFPNPFSSYFILKINELPDFDASYLKISDLSGRTMLNMRISKLETKIERGDLVNGVYLYSIVNNNRNIANGKLIVN